MIFKNFRLLQFYLQVRSTTNEYRPQPIPPEYYRIRMYFKYLILHSTVVLRHLNQTITLTYDELKELIQHEVNRSVYNVISEFKYGNFCGLIKRECLQVNMQGN